MVDRTANRRAPVVVPGQTTRLNIPLRNTEPEAASVEVEEPAAPVLIGPVEWWDNTLMEWVPDIIYSLTARISPHTLTQIVPVVQVFRLRNAEAATGLELNARWDSTIPVTVEHDEIPTPLYINFSGAAGPVVHMGPLGVGVVVHNIVTDIDGPVDYAWGPNAGVLSLTLRSPDAQAGTGFELYGRAGIDIEDPDDLRGLDNGPVTYTFERMTSGGYS